MCGIAGYFQMTEPAAPDHELIARMVNAIKHRGPDEFGAYFDNRCALGQARLSIIDLSGGSQPLCNEDGSVWVTFNGEIFNYVELRPELETRGHRFRTHSDTEVIVHAYEEYGPDCVQHFNGQFAFVIYDRNNEKIFAARDRLGIRPLFYTIQSGRFYFASEIKSIFCDPAVPRRLDLKGLDETFTWWTSAPPRTMFENINELEAGCFVEIEGGQMRTGRYWSMLFPETFDYSRPLESYAEELHALLVDAVRLQLRADVPVGAYLSGGLDSSVTTALVKHFTANRIETFSVTFDDKAFDESVYQNQMAEYLGTNHHTVCATYQSIAEAFPRVIWHTERPVVRTAPTPLYLLSDLVRRTDFKVVLTGEGSDEMLAGYDLFKETIIRAFWAKNPNSKWRPALLRKLYPTLPGQGPQAGFYLEQFYKIGLDQPDTYHFSHLPRISTTSKIKDFFSADVKAAVNGHDAMQAFGTDLPDGFPRWHHLAKAQYLEARSLLSAYLLSSQGDRVCAGNSIEGRYPFLDHRVAEFAATIPPGYKVFGLNEKYVLKRAMSRELPPEITKRVKQPYMAPDSNSFVQEDSPDYVTEMLSKEVVDKTGLFNSSSVERLVAKCRKAAGKHLSFKDNMSFVGILSSQLLAHHYIHEYRRPEPAPREAFTVWQDQSSAEGRKA